MARLSGSVGEGGKNLEADVKTVQTLLRGRGFEPGAAGICDMPTVEAIRAFQAGFLSAPDSRIDAGGRTWKQLVGEDAPVPLGDWSGDSSTWTQDKKLQSMKPEMAAGVRTMMMKLTARGFQPKIVYGWRSVAVQAQLFATGKSKVRFSFHNAQLPDGTPNSYAADIIDKRFAWSDEAASSGFWKALGEEARTQGMVWGGDWVSFRDWAHVQLVANGELRRVMQESGL